MSRPKKQKRTVQERKSAAAERASIQKKKDDKITYIAIGVICVLCLAVMVKLAFF